MWPQKESERMTQSENIVPENVLLEVSEYLNQDIESIRKKSPRFKADPCQCSNCGAELTFLDFVKTAHMTNQHSKKYMGAFFEQAKSMNKEFDTVIICGKCRTATDVHVEYKYVNYCPLP